MIKKFLYGAAASTAILASSASSAFADGYLDRYLDNLGRQQATEVGAQCGSGAGSGSFGYFGKDYNLGVNTDPADPGANGYQTGLNNSGVCGNRPN